MGLLSIFDGRSYSSGGLFGSSSGLPTGSVAILIVLAVMGASYVNSMTKRTRYFDTAVSVSGMLVGAFVANSLANGMSLPIDSELLKVAIIGLLGMTIAGLILLFAYGRNAD